MRAQILSIGSELILGHLTDTNATFLAQQLAGLGIELTLVTQVGDDLPRLAEAIDRASRTDDIVICTGGVGPTADDLTREAIAQVLGETPVVQPDLLETIRGFFRNRGIEMPERNAKQAWLIPSAEALPNPVGTAPGWFAHRGDHVIAAMPGVPREMFRMWKEQVVPRLMAMQHNRVVNTVTLRTIGIGESAAEQVLQALVALENPVVATYAKDDGVHVRVTATAATMDEAVAMRARAESEVESLLGAYIYGKDDTSLPEALSALLAANDATLAITDCGGAGRFASMLASHPASTDLLLSAMMSPRVGADAVALANEALTQEGATIGMGIQVTIEPSDAVFQGIISVALAGNVEAYERTPMRSAFEDIQRRSSLVAADVLRRALANRSAS